MNKFSTIAIHTGQKPEETTGAVIPPVFMTSTYAQESPGKFKGYDYTRAGNPNFTNLEQTLAALESGLYATVFSSGLGALTAMLSTLSSKSSILALDDLYGGSYRLFKNVFERFGVKASFTPSDNLKLLEKKLIKKPDMFFIESPTNPLLRITDIGAVSALAKKYGVLSIVDNTFATPYFQNPLKLGADVVWHSTTKYIGGHSDVIGGVVVTNNKKFKEKMDFARMALGLNPSPFDVWLLSRSLKTLSIRMEKHQENAIAIAEFLLNHPKVKQVYYPGLKSHPQHKIALKQMSGFSGVVSVELNTSLKRTTKLISSLKLFRLAESLGGVESLVDHPASMTHSSIPKVEREKVGLKDGLIRLSVGIEDSKDLLKDLSVGLDKL